MRLTQKERENEISTIALHRVHRVETLQRDLMVLVACSLTALWACGLSGGNLVTGVLVLVGVAGVASALSRIPGKKKSK